MNALDIMKRPAAYVSGYENTPTEEQNRAKQLCWEYNRTAPNEQEKRRSILQTLLGTCSPMTGIQPDNKEYVPPPAAPNISRGISSLTNRNVHYSKFYRLITFGSSVNE